MIFGRIGHLPSVVICSDRCLSVSFLFFQEIGILFKVAVFRHDVTATVTNKKEPLFMKAKSDSSPLVEGAEATGFKACAHVCFDKRSCLSGVDWVSLFFAGIVRRVFFPVL